MGSGQATEAHNWKLLPLRVLCFAEAITPTCPFLPAPTQGSCHFGTNIPEFYAAWPDTLEGFQGSCGRCLEVACRSATFTDNYGAKLDRSSGVCLDETRSVVVKIVDR
jgi:hypothetical protein